MRRIYLMVERQFLHLLFREDLLYLTPESFVHPVFVDSVHDAWSEVTFAIERIGLGSFEPATSE